MAFDVKKAERLARAIASDINIYNGEKINEGLKNDNFFEVLKDNFAEGKKAFEQRAGVEAAASGIFERAIVDVIIFSKANLESSIF